MGFRLLEKSVWTWRCAAVISACSPPFEQRPFPLTRSAKSSPDYGSITVAVTA